MTPYVALPIVAGLTLMLGIGFPLLRSFLRDGTVPFVRPRSELQRFVHAIFAATLLGYGIFTVVLPIAGPGLLGVYQVPDWVVVLGLAISTAGLALVIAAQAQMGRSWRIGIDASPTELVTHGVFRISRNPIYLGMLGVALGAGIVAPSGWTLVGTALVYVVVGFQARAEEEHLVREHGEAYRRWARGVGRLLPWFGRLRTEEP